MGTTNIELQSIISKLNFNTTFKGVLMKDQLKELNRTDNEFGICNTQDTSQNGKHWCMWFIKDNTKYYFDSYGSPILPELREYLGGNILSSTFQIQSWNGEDNKACGEYCCIVAYLLDRGCQFEDVILSLYENE